MGSSPSAPARSVDVGSASIAIHIGAHRTGSTYFQQMLEQSRAGLSEQGVALLTPKDIRQGTGEVAPPFALGLQALDDGAERLCLSEENVAGQIRTRVGNMLVPLYPKALELLQPILEQAAPRSVELYLAIRHPLDIMLSVYSQVLMSGITLQPEVFFLDLNPQAVDWHRLVRRLSTLEGLSGLTIWRYEDFRADPVPALDAFVGQAGVVQPVEQLSHPSLSVPAVTAVLDGQDAKLARSEWPVPEHPRFDPFGSDLHHDLQMIYDDQWHAMAALPKVTRLYV